MPGFVSPRIRVLFFNSVAQEFPIVSRSMGQAMLLVFLHSCHADTQQAAGVLFFLEEQQGRKLIVCYYCCLSNTQWLW
jgi:hypothetical protein